MQSNEIPLVYWAFGSGLASVAYGFLSLRMLGQGYLKNRFDGIGFSILVAIVVTMIWSFFGFSANSLDPKWWVGTQSADLLRYFWWIVFLGLFFRSGKKNLDKKKPNKTRL